MGYRALLARGVGAGVLVSLVTSPVEEEKLNNFYDLTRTPITKGEVLTQTCTFPAGVQPAPRRMLTTAFGLEIPVPSTTSVVGFLAGWIMVGAMIGGFVWLVS